MILIRNVPDIGVGARNGDLAGAGEIEMTEAADVVSKRSRLSFHFVHCVHILRSSCPPKAGHPVSTEFRSKAPSLPYCASQDIGSPGCAGR